MDMKIFKCLIDEDCNSDLEVNFVALVDRPAIERNFLAFKNKQAFEINDDRRIISGPAMLADFPIYRKDKEFGEYYVTFDKATIEQIAIKFFKKGYNLNFNIAHDENQKLDGIVVFESFVTDKDRGIMPMKGFEDAEDGSWFLSAKVEDDSTWDKIKAGELQGFSVEGIFQYLKMGSQKPKLTAEQALAEIHRLLNETYH